MSLEKDVYDDKYNPEESNISRMENKDIDKTTVDNLSNLINNICLGRDQQKADLNKNDHEFDNKNTVTIPDWLKDYETPFSWHLEQEQGLGSELVILRTLEKLDELFIDEPEFSLERFVSLLKLVLSYFLVGDIDRCCENMKIIDGCLEEEISKNDPLYQKVKLSLGHVVSATKAHVLYIIGKEEESKNISKNIIPMKIMADPDKAALCSMKARFFIYSGYENGEAVSVGYSRKALELEPDNAEWEYVLAKMLRQLRRDVPFSNEVPRDELKLLESAVKRVKTPKYIVYLAQVYRECSSQAFKQYRNHRNFHGELQSSIELMAEKSLDYYREALSLSPDSPAVLRRVGYGIMNLPRKFADYDLALECLLKSLDISENQMTLHVLGTFYHRYGNDNQKALEYFERTAKAGSWYGLSDMIRIKWTMDHEYDPCSDFQIGLSWNIKKKYHNQGLAQLGAYHLFIKRDFYKACEYFKQVILNEKDSPHLKSFKSFFLRMKEPIDLYEYLANEALLLVQKHNSGSTIEPEISDKEAVAVKPAAGLGIVEDFLDLISKVRPELMENTPDTNMVPRLIQASKNIEASGYNWGNRGRYSGYQGGRNNHSHGNRNDGQDSRERRGRFPFSSEKEKESEREERRGGGRRGGNYRGQNKNWQPQSRGSGRDHENWRKK